MKWFSICIILSTLIVTNINAQKCSALALFKSDVPVDLLYSVTYDTFKTSKQEYIKVLSDSTPQLTSKLLKRNRYDKYIRGAYVYDTWLNLIDLSNNGIETIENGAFMEISNCLQSIYLKYNLITHIETNTFLKLFQLKKLDLTGNKIKLIDAYAFNQTNLDILILSQNNLINLTNEEIFYNLRNLTYLDLSYNQINVIKSFKYLENLKILNLTNNNLTVLPQMLFSQLTNLTILKLDANNIKQLGIGVFKYLKLLDVLSLGDNRLSSFQLGTFYGLKNLRELNISYNLLTDTHEKKLFTIDNLRTLILDGNNISSTMNVREMTSHLLKLRMISLANMQWNCSHLLAVMKQFALRGITVSENILADHINDINIKGILCNDTETIDQESVVKSIVNIAEALSETNLSLIPEQINKEDKIIEGLIYDHKTIHQILIFLVVVNIIVLIAIFREDITSLAIKRHKRQLMLSHHNCRTNNSQSEVELIDSH